MATHSTRRKNCCSYDTDICTCKALERTIDSFFLFFSPLLKEWWNSASVCVGREDGKRERTVPVQVWISRNSECMRSVPLARLRAWGWRRPIVTLVPTEHAAELQRTTYVLEQVHAALAAFRTALASLLTDATAAERSESGVSLENPVSITADAVLYGEYMMLRLRGDERRYRLGAYSTPRHPCLLFFCLTC